MLSSWQQSTTWTKRRLFPISQALWMSTSFLHIFNQVAFPNSKTLIFVVLKAVHFGRTPETFTLAEYETCSYSIILHPLDWRYVIPVDVVHFAVYMPSHERANHNNKLNCAWYFYTSLVFRVKIEKSSDDDFAKLLVAEWAIFRTCPIAHNHLAKEIQEALGASSITF